MVKIQKGWQENASPFVFYDACIKLQKLYF